MAIWLRELWYSFRVSTQVHASKQLNVYISRCRRLFLSNDYTGHSELYTLFLDPDYHYGENGKLLSKVRLMFIVTLSENALCSG